MRLFGLVFLLLLPGIVFSEGPKKLTITGATWMSYAGEDNNPVRTHDIETDALGRITKVYETRSQKSGMVIVYSDNKVKFSFGAAPEVKIDASMTWAKQKDGNIKIEYRQQNDVPEQVVSGKKYPREILKKSYSIVLSTPSPAEYTWKEIRGESWLEEDGRSQYHCIPGKQVVWDQYDENGKLMYQTILDGHTSDASPETTSKMFYSKKENSVVGKYFWTYEPTAWNESTWAKGGGIEYSGDSLSTKDPVITVVNYYILKLWFYSDAWNYFGPTLFGIPIP